MWIESLIPNIKILITKYVFSVDSMSSLYLSPLKVRELEEPYVDLCKIVAGKAMLSEEDTQSIFQFNVEKTSIPRAMSITLEVKEKRPIVFTESGPIIEVLGDNQAGKTTTLLYMANLLGYDFFNEDNANFLGDDNLVRQGQNIFDKLVRGMEARLEVVAEPHNLSIWTENGVVKVEVTERSEIIKYQLFSLSTMSAAFTKFLHQHISSQFVSKGRNFDRLLLMDISDELSWYVQRFRERAGYLTTKIRGMSDELIKKAKIAEGVDLNARKLQIGIELKNLGETRSQCEMQLAETQLKLEATIQLMKKLPKVEKTKVFKLLCKIQGLNERISMLEQRKSGLETQAATLNALRTQIEEYERQLKILKSKILLNREKLETIDSGFEQAIATVEKNIDQFRDDSVANEILMILRDRDIDSIFDKQKQEMPGASEVVEDLFKMVMKYNPTIMLPENLGGSVEALQDTLKSARHVVNDAKLITGIIGSLVKILSEKQIQSSESYSQLSSEVEELEIESKGIEESIVNAKNKITEAGLSENQRLINKTTKELKDTTRKLHDLQGQIEKFVKPYEKELVELERLATMLENEHPESLIYTTDWADGLLKWREELEKKLDDSRLLCKSTQEKIDKLREESRTIEDILKSREYQEYLNRIDRIDTFRSILQTMNDILGNWKYLTKRDEAYAQFASLDKHGITEVLDETINEMFLKRCKSFFLMVNDKCKIEQINGFDYFKRTFHCNDTERSIEDLSGGTASTMTVLSLASKTINNLFGMILLVDEFHDVASTLREETYSRLRKKEGLNFSFFARPLDGSPLIIRTANAEE